VKDISNIFFVKDISNYTKKEHVYNLQLFNNNVQLLDQQELYTNQNAGIVSQLKNYKKYTSYTWNESPDLSIRHRTRITGIILIGYSIHQKCKSRSFLF